MCVDIGAVEGVSNTRERFSMDDDWTAAHRTLTQHQSADEPSQQQQGQQSETPTASQQVSVSHIALHCLYIQGLDFGTNRKHFI